jgi:hypothetical protein
MAILLAMLRTLLDEGLDAVPLIDRLNVQIGRHAPSSRFITLQFVSINPDTGDLVAVNAGHLPGLIRRRTGAIDRLTEGGIALGMFDHSHYTAQAARLEPGDLLVLYSDGITEAESPSGAPFDEAGLMAIIRAHADNPSLPEIGKAVIRAVERHAQDVRFSDDLTILLARRPIDSGFTPSPGADATGFGEASGVRDSGLRTADSDVVVPPIPSSQHASFQRKPRSWSLGSVDPGALDPGIRRGDDSLDGVPPVPSPESRVPNPESRTLPPAPRS